MFSSTFPPRPTLLLIWYDLPFNPLNCFAVSFQDNLSLVDVFRPGFPIGEEDSSMADIWSKGLNESVCAYIK